MEKKRLAHVDIMKTIAMFFVVIYHGKLSSCDFITNADLVHYARYFFRAILAAGVPLFFFVNGYLLFGSNFNLRKHVFKMAKLIIITIAWAIITMLILQVVRGEYFSLVEFMKAIWNWKQDWVNHLWYMGALICIYVFFPLLKNAYDTNFKTFCYFTVICSVFTFGNTFLNHAGTVLSSLFLENPMTVSGENFFNIFNPFRGLNGYSFGYFCIGGLAVHFREAIESVDIRKRNVISAAGLILSCLGLFTLGLCYSSVRNSVWSIVWSGYDAIFTLSNVGCIYLLSLNWKKDSGLVRTISGNTLGIYFIHCIIIYLIKPWLLNYPVLFNTAFSCIFSIFVMAVSLLICLVMRKCPVICALVK